MRIEPVAHSVARYYVELKIRASDPLFISLYFPMVKGHAPLELFFLLDWWGQYNTYIARQVLPANDFVGEQSFTFTYPRFDVRWKKVIKHKLRLTVGVKHLVDVTREKTADQMLARLGVRSIASTSER